MILKNRKQKKITKKELKEIALANNATKAKTEDIYVFGDLELILFLDGERSGRVYFQRELENLGEYSYTPVVQIAGCL